MIWQTHSATIGLLTKMYPINTQTGQYLVDMCALLSLAGHQELTSDGASETQTQPEKGISEQAERACG